MSEKELKLTDLDYAIGDHHLQMLKAALPYMEIPQQRAMSMFVKWNELMRTMEFFEENNDGMMSICSLDADRVSATDMLEAVKPYANQREQTMPFRPLTTAARHERPGRQAARPGSRGGKRRSRCSRGRCRRG